MKKDFDGMDENELTPEQLEEHRRVEFIRRVLLETLNVVYREYDVQGLKKIRHCVKDAKTWDEIYLCAQMIVTIGRFHGGAL